VPLPAGAGGFAPSAIARAVEPRLARVARWEPITESLEGIGALPGDAQRQMSALRVGLESALTDRPTRVVLLASSRAREGTTTVTVQLATTLAREGRQRVLVMDLNVARPTVESEPGWLTTRLPAAMTMVSEGDEESAATIDALPVPAEAKEGAMYSPTLAREVLDALAPRYDWVLLDAAPALETPETAALAALADGVVVVIQAGRTKRPVVARMVDLLRKSGARVLGTVLNRRRLEIPDFIYRRL
jgi:Mrp family chromosome partitioning ATPase